MSFRKYTTHSLTVALIISVLMFFLFSCENNITESQTISENQTSEQNSSGNTFDFIGSLNASSALPEVYANTQVSRSAYPGVETSYVFRCNATHGTTTINGSVTGHTIRIPGLEFNVDYTITVWLENPDAATEAEKILMSDSKSNVKITESSPAYSYVFCPRPVTTEGSGTIQLPISFNYSDSTATDKIRVNKVIITCAQNSALNKTFNSIPTSNTNILYQTSASAGTYEVFFKYLNAADPEDASDTDVVLYSDLQTISVFKNMKTNKWNYDSASSPAIDSTGDYKITEALIRQNSNEYIYVGDTNLGDEPGLENTGYLYSPFENLNQVIKYIKATGSSSKNYQINICGTQNGNFKFAGDSIDTKAASILLQRSPTQTANAVLNGTSDSAAVLTFSNAPPVTIKGLTITGGNNTSTKKGGGITAATTNLTLDEDTRIENNHAELMGGGVYVAGTTAVLNIKSNVYIYGNTCGTTTQSSSNLYLDRDDLFINVTGALKKGNQNARIGISKRGGPPTTDSPIVFTSGYGYNNGRNKNVKPGRYFIGDDYGVTYNTSGEAILAASGGSVDVDDFYDDVVFSIDNTTVAKNSSQKTFTFTAKTKDENNEWVTIPVNQINWNYTVLVHGDTVPSNGGYYIPGSGTNANQLSFTNSLPPGTYSIFVSGVYDGTTYGSEFTVSIVDALVPSGTSGSSIAEQMMDGSVLELEVYFDNNFRFNTPDIPDSEKESSEYYSYRNDWEIYEKHFSCIIPEGKTLELKANRPVTLTCDAVYKFFKVYGTLIIGENITLSGQGMYHNMITIENGGTVILDGGTITNGGAAGTIYSPVTVCSGATFQMDSGLITASLCRGAVYVEGGGTFEMTGGEISGNHCIDIQESDGTIYCAASAVSVKASGIFIKTGGTIKNNTRGDSNESSQVYLESGAQHKYNDSTLNIYTSPSHVTTEY